MALGPEAGLAIVDPLLEEPSLKNYHLLPSVRGDLLSKLGRLDEARAEFTRAASLTRNAREKELLMSTRPAPALKRTTKPIKMTPRPFLTIAPGRLVVREGGGCMTLFGMPFLAAGLFLMLAGAGIVPLETGHPPSFRLAFLFFGLPFMLVGGGLVFGRSWTTLSSTDRTVVKQMGLLVPMRSTSYRVDEYNGVLLDFVRGDSDSADQYPVSLKARAGGNLRLFSSTTYAEARQRATAIAALFHFEIEDSSTAHPVRLTAAEADMSFQHRRRLEHQRDEPIARPASMRSDVRDDGGSVTIVIPARRWPAPAYLFFLLPIAVPVFSRGPVLAVFSPDKDPRRRVLGFRRVPDRRVWRAAGVFGSQRIPEITPRPHNR